MPPLRIADEGKFGIRSVNDRAGYKCHPRADGAVRSWSKPSELVAEVRRARRVRSIPRRIAFVWGRLQPSSLCTAVQS
jgi:hypothetical protein